MVSTLKTLNALSANIALNAPNRPALLDPSTRRTPHFAKWKSVDRNRRLSSAARRRALLVARGRGGRLVTVAKVAARRIVHGTSVRGRGERGAAHAAKS
jgi:hypothetical protein